MPRGALEHLRALFEQKENFNVYSSAKGDRYYIQTRQNDLFPITIFIYENWKKNWPEKRA